MDVTIHELAALVGGRLAEEGNVGPRITGAASIADATEGQVTFFGNARYLPALKRCRASAALVPLEFSEEIGPELIHVENPSLAFAQILEKFAPPAPVYASGVHPSAIIGENVTLAENVSVQPYAVVEQGARIGADTFIGAHSFIGQGSTLGAGCKIHPHVTLRENSLLGARVTIHSGTVVGSDGFGYEFAEGAHVKIPQIGFVQIDDDVEIGANVTIDRARFGRTWIQEGTKIDNLVQIAHNVTIGKHCILVSQVGISGSTRLGNYVTLAGQVGLVGHIEVGDQAIVGAKSGVSKSVPAKEHWFGIPAMPEENFKTRFAYINRLAKLNARVKALEQRLEAQEKSARPAGSDLQSRSV
ncbi:MAG: UDP-3-O-[3-hydroxymyristoyl] glucosamine N-acyltransferase [Chthoniobacter sp.]|jgi:UDP-3-O-[3-hydroxymyristoyl] glucosamine N-acyltransferase|nr:UDP-3-O-[3-hydroxymyristoyl] glucosamine N-acyltransferase [Chthoniobacter sp.]